MGAGVVFAVDAVCPHLGANMGRGGKVVGNTIEWSATASEHGASKSEQSKRRKGEMRAELMVAFSISYWQRCAG